MSCYKKHRQQHEVPMTEFPDIIYKPCGFCGSDDYDFANGNVDDDGIYAPDVCDVCNFGNIRESSILLH